MPCRYYDLLRGAAPKSSFHDFVRFCLVIKHDYNNLVHRDFSGKIVYERFFLSRAEQPDPSIKSPIQKKHLGLLRVLLNKSTELREFGCCIAAAVLLEQKTR